MQAAPSAEEVVRRFPRGSRIAVLCGPGNNGGDGFVCARYLRERGYHVRLALNARKEDLKRDPKEMAKRWDEGIEPLSLQFLEGAQVIVDAIYGTGLRDDVTGLVAQIIEEVTARSLPVVAIDVPSGIDATSGAVHGVAFKAVSTVTFFRRKTGHVLLPGRLYCGDVRAADIGIPPSRARGDRAGVVCERPGLLASLFPQAQGRRPQIRPRPCPRGFGADGTHGRRADCRQDSAARGRGACNRGDIQVRLSTSTHRSSPR